VNLYNVEIKEQVLVVKGSAPTATLRSDGIFT